MNAETEQKAAALLARAAQLRAAAKECRNYAQFAEGNAYHAEMAQAVRLETEANEKIIEHAKLVASHGHR